MRGLTAGIGTILLGTVALWRTAGALIVPFPPAEAECEYVQRLVSQLQTELHQADRLTHESAIARTPSSGRQPEEVGFLLGKLDELEAAIDRSEEVLEVTAEDQERAKSDLKAWYERRKEKQKRGAAEKAGTSPEA
jgi:hypothetical protein